MATVAEMRDMDDIDDSNEAVSKEGASINGDLSCDDDKEDCDETSEVSAGNNCSSRDDMDQDQSSTDKINCDEDNNDSCEETVEDYEEGEKMDVDDVTLEEEENSEQIQEVDNSDIEEESDDDSKTDNIQNGLNSSDEITCEEINKDSESRPITIRDSIEDVVVLDDKDPIEVLDKDGVEIVDDDCYEDNKESVENGSTIESDDDDDDVQISETVDNHNRVEDEDDDVISLEDESPAKSKSSSNDSTAPRRSSRNLNREKKRYSEDEYVLNVKKKVREDSSEESDIEEVLPVDPLADSSSAMVDQEKPKKSRASSSTIVVKDTKCLAEIASKSSSNSNSKKEPTLVIIDTNSILSGRGPVPLSQKSSISTSISNSYSMIPMALPAQGVYPPNMRATITPIPMPSVSAAKSAQSAQPLQPVLPTLSDDMFVVEAPSFIVPYVYEKPPIKDLQQLIKDLETQIIEEKIRKDKEEEESNKKSDEKKSEDEEMETDDADGEKEKKGEEKENLNDDDDGEKDVEKLVSANYLSTSSGSVVSDLKKPGSYFQSPLGKFFMGIGYGLVQEAVQSDLLKQQKRRREREGNQNPETTKTISLLLKNLECTKEHNEPYRMVTKKCEYCSFKTESALVMAYHLETPHMKNYIYRCNFCPYEVRSPHDILYHMEVQHGVKGRLERAPAFHQCPNCVFEDNQKGKLSRHSVSCARKYKPEHNLEPPLDYEPPAKIPRAPRMKQQGLGSAAAVYQAMAKNSQYQMMTKMATNVSPMQRVKGRTNLSTTIKQANIRPSPGTNLLYKQANMSGGSVLVPTNYQLGGNQLYQVVGGQEMGSRLYSGATAFVPGISAAPNSVSIQQQQQQNSMNKMKQSQQPSISITPLPRGSTTTSSISMSKPGDSNSKNSFVICEICDGYIKDLEQLRNHMQWIHKVKIHPKMIYNRPPLNCQKCQFRFFTDQGLERHLLGSHGLVTSSMQEAANRSKDAGRCPVCGRVYQWKLLNHVARDHNMTLKPAHLSYKCTVCTATFGMYKQFESHVYSAHSVVAKRVMDKKTSTPTSSTNKNESVLKPLKINDEITIIPQPAKSTNGISGSKEGSPSTSAVRNSGSFSNGNPSSSKKEGSESPSLSRAERLSRRKSNLQSDN